MARKRKRVDLPGQTPRAKKRAVALPTTTGDDYPSWRIGQMQLVDPFGWHALEREKLLEIREKLAHFERRTWNEILVRSKKHNHTVERDRISRDAQKRLADSKMDEVEQLVSLRLSSKERIWGIRQGAVLLLLWWDPEHQVYPSAKKHT